MAQVTCSKCGNTAEGLERAPFPGSVGEELLARVCAACWKEWMGQQVILINENKLTPADPQHYALLIAEMKKFLLLAD